MFKVHPIFPIRSCPSPFRGALKSSHSQPRTRQRWHGTRGPGRGRPAPGTGAMRGPALPLARRAGAALGLGRAAGQDPGQVRRGRGWSQSQAGRAGAAAGSAEGGPRSLPAPAVRAIDGKEPARPVCAARVPPPQHRVSVPSSVPWVSVHTAGSCSGTDRAFPGARAPSRCRSWNERHGTGRLLGAPREGNSAFALGVCLETKSSFPSFAR